jgi:very-short-patch-repair endonuclease
MKAEPERSTQRSESSYEGHDWSHLLDDYQRLGSIRKVARLHHKRDSFVRAELVQRGLKIGAAEPDWSNLAADYERLGSLTRLAKHYGVRFDAVRAELLRQGIPIKPRGHVKGQKKSQAWRDASARHWNDPLWRAQQRERWLERLPTMNGHQANSPLERLLHRALRKAGISFSTQRRMLDRYVVDILIEQKPIIIEADGSMHLHARSRARDAVRDADFRAAGYQVFRFTGKLICNDPDGCIGEVIATCGLTSDTDPVYDVRNGMKGPDSPTWKGGKREWICQNPACGKTFRAWKRGYGRTPQCCSRECQVEWQKATKASVANRRSNGNRMRELWADPQWRKRQVKLQQKGRMRVQPPASPLA